MPVAGVEPAPCCQEQILSLPSLPIPSHRQGVFSRNRPEKRASEIGGRFGGRFRKNRDIQFSKALIYQGFPASDAGNDAGDFESRTSANSITPACL